MSNLPRSQLKRSKYRVLGLVGQGQFGRVYCAVNRQTGQLVALKSLDHQRFPTHKFLRELRFLLSLQHPNIVTCQALEHTATGRHLVMDYCEGGTLRSLMNESQHLTLRQRLKLIIDILQGLDHAHSRGIIHCDIKPENILLNLQPTGWTARISDFGIAHLSQEGQEAGGQGLGNTGSPAYMAPERFYGQYPLNSDLYAVGILLFELLVGYRPFSGTPGELMSAHLNCPVKIPDTIPEAWRSIILISLQKLSARRFRSAKAMLAAIQEVAMQKGLGKWLHLQVSLAEAQGSSIAFTSHQQEALKQPITALASPSGEECSSKIASLFEVWHQVFPDNAIQSLLVRPQGCFVLTKRSLHLLPLLPSVTATSETVMSHLLELPHDCVAAVEPMGRWFATLENTRAAKLCFWRLQDNSLQASQGDPCGICEAARAIRLTCSTIALQSMPILPPFLFALDAHHVAVMTTVPDRQQPRDRHRKGGTVVQVLTRRGTKAGLLKLPVQIGQAVQTSVPYQLLATDTGNPKSILLIDLKPYRILRLRVGIVPKFLSATTWGFILADALGSIVFLAQDGEILGRVQGPTGITAIASCNAHDILVATWNNNQGKLYTSDLRDLKIDLLF